MFIYGFIPIAQYFMANPLAKYQSIFDEMWIYARDLYENHVKTYDSNNLRDFCDTIIAAKYEAIADNKPSAKYLTDENLITTMCGLINAGVETTQDTVLWILLYIAYYPDYQQKLRNEISREIGDRVPVFEDKSRLNYTLAFMTEILRHRNPAPIGNFHRTVVDTHLG
ncbi:unnamed protein product [Medioppia subpectinata]|uniref:Cytochrome P450 n=1 Tax=Medioppia subpectinata TaxID=1979941 RepID=A0A7R9KKR0_9ACAR|nr:unnamed protein product [Medioppia subpectinata]CAG2105255.1 unnamed protein product [Medioppia subpectinata]